MRRLIIVLSLLSVLLCFPQIASAQLGTNTWTANPAPPAQTADANLGYPVEPFASARMSTSTTATTTATAVTNIAGRKKITFFVKSSGASAEVVWVSLGTTTASIGAGVPIVSSGSSVIAIQQFNADSNVAVGYVSAAATSVTVMQEGPNQTEIQRK